MYSKGDTHSRSSRRISARASTLDSAMACSSADLPCGSVSRTNSSSRAKVTLGGLCALGRGSRNDLLRPFSSRLSVCASPDLCARSCLCLSALSENIWL
jgi:hypothetical protein